MCGCLFEKRVLFASLFIVVFSRVQLVCPLWLLWVNYLRFFPALLKGKTLFGLSCVFWTAATIQCLCMAKRRELNATTTCQWEKGFVGGGLGDWLGVVLDTYSSLTSAWLVGSATTLLWLLRSLSSKPSYMKLLA